MSGSVGSEAVRNLFPIALTPKVFQIRPCLPIENIVSAVTGNDDS